MSKTVNSKKTMDRVVDFVTQADSIITTDMAKMLNSTLNQSKTSMLSVKLLLKLKLQIETEQVDKEEVDTSKGMNVKELVDSMSVNIDTENNTVKFTFLYNKPKHLKRILAVLSKYPEVMTFMYIKQVHATILLWDSQTFNSQLIKQHRKVASITQYIVCAKELAMNKLAADTFKASNTDWGVLTDLIVVGSSTNPSTELAQLVKDAPTLKVTKLSKKYSKLQILAEKYINIPTAELSGTSLTHGYQTPSSGDKDVRISNLSNQLMNDINSMAKGTAIGDLFNLHFDAIDTDINLFDRLEKMVDTDVYNKIGASDSSWKGLNNCYRHIYTAPIREDTEHKLDIILSIDVSASVDTESLAKFASIISKHGADIGRLRVIQHTSAVIKSWDMKEDENITDAFDFKEAVSSRQASGGTSFLDTFKHISKMGIEDPSKVIYFAFSDFLRRCRRCMAQIPYYGTNTKYILHSSRVWK